MRRRKILEKGLTLGALLSPRACLQFSCGEAALRERAEREMRFTGGQAIQK